MNKDWRLSVRKERPLDREQIWKVNAAAFARSDDADLVNRLRADGDVLLSLVAEADGVLVGHILFSRMTIETNHQRLDAAALAPMAVLPEHQSRGLGSQLVRHGLDQLRDRGERIVIVVGHPRYYPRFGFSSEKARGLRSPFHPEAFMALDLSRGALDGVRGVVRYPSAFGL